MGAAKRAFNGLVSHMKQELPFSIEGGLFLELILSNFKSEIYSLDGIHLASSPPSDHNERVIRTGLFF
jgi:hypothetical protein